MVRLVTHNGTFHYDEVLATVILRMIYKDTEMMRTRDSELIATGDIVYDVGATFDPSHNRYDHHQAGFKETFDKDSTVKLSSAGLVYKYFYKRLFALYSFNSEHYLYEFIYNKIYKEFFLYADALDNGYSINNDIQIRSMADVVARFNRYDDDDRKGTDKTGRKHGHDRGSNDKKSAGSKQAKANDSAKREMEQFEKAVEFVKIDFENYLNFIFNDYLVAFEQIHATMKIHSGDIFISPINAPMDLLFDVDHILSKNIKYVIFENKQDFRITALPVCKGKFETRAPLKKEWRGLRGEELEKVSGIEGCTFVHATGFTGGCKTLDGVMRMGKMSLFLK